MPTEEGTYDLVPNLDPIGWYEGNSDVTDEWYDSDTDTDSPYNCSATGPENLWYEGATWCGPHAAKGKNANDWGLFDMSGNAWEWVWDGYNYYPTDTTEENPKENYVVAPDNYTGITNPDIDTDSSMDTDTDLDLILRGGCWGFSGNFARSAMRHHFYYDEGYKEIKPGSHSSNNGFRLVRTVD